MVMESPSPQCVGREFVRQYYTMLNQAPLHLHRFYSQNSSFVHGGIDLHGVEEKPVMGQQDIHQKIMQLNFRDCHAKIRQVDSHATLDSGVVVQVTGELSNNGLPMRRFMQTFVLAPQSPKKYYVRNDIFRYQDEVFSEEEDEPECAAESEPEDEPVELIMQQGTNRENVQDPSIDMYYENAPISNGTHVEEIQESVTPTKMLSESPSAVDVSADQSQIPVQDVADDVPSDEEKPGDVQSAVESDSDNKDSYDIKTDPGLPSQPEQKTYANIVGRITGGANANINVGVVPPVGNGKTPVTQPPVSVPSFQPPNKQETSPREFNSNSTTNTTNNNSRVPRNNRGGMSNKTRDVKQGPVPPYKYIEECAGEVNAKEKRTGSTIGYPDSQQIFVGNLPHSITDAELREFFSQWGTVIDSRINIKPNIKSGNNTRLPPNFGFIVFEKEDSVKQVLDEKKPILYQNNHRLNVEVKKAKNRSGPNMMNNANLSGEPRPGLNDPRPINSRPGNRVPRGGARTTNMGNRGRGGFGNPRR